MTRRWTEPLRAWWPARPRLLPADEHDRVLAGARIERHGGLTVLYLAGTPYEMGYQHGVLARDQIHGFRQAAYAYVASLVPGPAWLARPLLFYHAAAYWPTISPELAQEMEGIADGAGVHPIEVLASTAIWEMFLVSGCSEFAAAGPATADRDLIHGYNYDLMHPDHALIQPYLAALFYRPNQGIPFVTVNTVGSVGANAGMNQAGISVAWDNTYLKDDELIREIAHPAVPFIITLRRLLQHSRRLDEALRIITETLPRPLGDIVIVGSASEGRAVALETAGRVHAVREMEEETIWSSNCFQSPALAPHDRRGDGRDLPEGEAWQHFPRYRAYTQLFAAQRGRLTPAVAAAFLRDPYPREGEGFVHPAPAPRATICRDLTSWSLVMEPGKGRLWISDAEIPGCQGPFFAFNLAGPAERLPELDLAATGYRAAVQSAKRLLAGDRTGAQVALADAMAADGPAAPLLLMQGILHGLEGEAGQAEEVVRQVMAQWEQTAAGKLARAWIEGWDGEDLAPIPFPSAIRPLLHLRPAPMWEDRAVPA